MANPLTSLFLDPAAADRERAPRKYQFTDDWRAWLVPVALGLALLVLSLLSLLGGDAARVRFFYAYLVGWVFCVSIAVGALFFVMIQHVVKARWVTVLRRIPEHLVAGFPLLALLGIPVLFGMHDLYHWTHADLYERGGSHFDPILFGKSPYYFWPANPGTVPVFWLLRVVAYFLLWSYLGRRLFALSVRNDAEPSAENTLKLRRVSAWGIPIAAVATSFASYDLVMSLDPHWFSTIFGVYFFAGGWLAMLSLVTFIGLALRRRGLLDVELTREHFHDMGKLMFGFVVFWAYIAFSQYMLIWYGNLPEETRWFMDRLSKGWTAVTAGLLVFHFILPFLLLLPRFVKRTYPLLGFMAGWLLVMHWYDLFWLSVPTIGAEEAHTVAEHAGRSPEVAETAFRVGESALPGATQNVPFAAVSEAAQAHFAWVDFSAWLGLFALFMGLTLWRMGRHALTPYNDPYFADSVRFENV
ncbi:MAG TPA: hypothetical protein VD962_10285 [Rubricoccaceae bacterium]|nr:hypothetical protein [Rubricoccaceae bacterium]